MNDRENDFLVWQDTLERLRRLRECAGLNVVTPRYKSRTIQATRPWKEAVAPTAESQARNDCVRIRIAELSAGTATLSWHDSTACHYEDQKWRRGKARRAGICSLSGQSVMRGADVFRPSRRGVRGPVNSDAMILASALAYHVETGAYDVFDWAAAEPRAGR